jgi:hypothetical protein
LLAVTLRDMKCRLSLKAINNDAEKYKVPLLNLDLDARQNNTIAQYVVPSAVYGLYTKQPPNSADIVVCSKQQQQQQLKQWTKEGGEYMPNEFLEAKSKLSEIMNEVKIRCTESFTH